MLYTVEEIFPNSRHVLFESECDKAEAYRHWEYWLQQWREGWLKGRALHLVRDGETIESVWEYYESKAD